MFVLMSVFDCVLACGYLYKVNQAQERIRLGSKKGSLYDQLDSCYLK